MPSCPAANAHSSACSATTLMATESMSPATGVLVAYARSEMRCRCDRSCVLRPLDRPEPVAPPDPLEHVRDVWTLHSITSIATARIYRSVFGLALGTDLAGDLIESRLSRIGESH